MYREKLFCAYNNIYNYNIYFGKNAINYLEKVTPKIPKDNLSELKVDKYIKDFGINHNLIKQINIAEKKIPVAYVRALRDYIIKNYDFKNCLNSFLEDIIDNFKNVSYEDLQVSLNVFHEILCCNQLLSDEWHKIFLTSPKRKYYAFNQPYIKKRLQEKLKIPVKSVVFSDVDSYKIEPYKKNLIILLKKPGNLHQAPLIRIVNNNKIYWILMETIAESYKWFAPINYEIFYELLRKLVKYDQEKNPTKEVKGYLNRVKLQNSKYLCEVFAYANSLSIFENLEEFIAFLDSYQPQARKDYKLELTYLENTNNLFPEYEDIIELTYLPNFIAKFCQSISSEESKKALSSMILLDNDSTKSKKINATILLYSCELLKNVINEIYLTFSNDYQTDCMLYYKKSNLEYK